MSFEFNSEFDESMSKTFGNLLQTNNGLFKSKAQASFILRKCSVADKGTVVLSCKLDPGTRYMVVAGVARFAEYGYKSRRRVEHLYIIDDNGIFRKIKIKFNYSADGKHSWVDPNSNDIAWERPEDLIVVPFETVAEEAPVEKIVIGVPGEVLETSATIKKIQQFEGRSFSYYDSGIRFKTTLQDAKGAILVYWGYLKNSMDTATLLNVGDTVRIKAKIKEINEYKGCMEHIIQRPKASLLEGV